jgi:hypothetical protein
MFGQTDQDMQPSMYLTRSREAAWLKYMVATTLVKDLDTRSNEIEYDRIKHQGKGPKGMQRIET